MALRLRPPTREEDARTPAHFIVLLDVSESMSDDNKLTYVKHCMSLLLKYMTLHDELSLVTFGDTADIKLRRCKVGTPAGTAAAANMIQSLYVDGCTNMSAGLAAVREILDEGQAGTVAAPTSMKEVLLLLTDGHANRGASTTDALRTIVRRVREVHPGLSISFVAYGTEHNAELLKGMAEESAGGYSIVEDMEGAAMSMGDALGSAISCVAQNIVVDFPVGTVGSGPHIIAQDSGMLALGDLYAGTEVLILAKLPVAAATAPTVRIRGAILPTLDPISLVVTDCARLEGRDADIELTQLRYECSALFRRLREAAAAGSGGSAQAAALSADINSFKEKVQDPFFEGHPVTEMLKREIPSLVAALEGLRERTGRPELMTRLLQHEAYTSLGRGTSQPIELTPHVHWADEEDPDCEEERGSPSPRASLPVGFTPSGTNLNPQRPQRSYMSPIASRAQQRIAAEISMTASTMNATRVQLNRRRGGASGH